MGEPEQFISDTKLLHYAPGSGGISQLPLWAKATPLLWSACTFPLCGLVGGWEEVFVPKMSRLCPFPISHFTLDPKQRLHVSQPVRGRSSPSVTEEQHHGRGGPLCYGPFGAGVAVILQLSSPSGQDGGGAPRGFSGVGKGLRVPAASPVSDGVSSTQIVVNCCCFV